MHLAEHEQSQIIGLVAEFEAKSGAEALVAVVGNADTYPEIPWKAFALGAALAALLMALGAWLAPQQILDQPAFMQTLAVLGGGAVCGLLASLVPAFSRLFLDPLRAEAEVRQYAQAMFLQRELFRTRDRNGLLVLISLFERRVVILPDSGLGEHLPAARLEAAINGMKPMLARQRTVDAVAAGLAILADALRPGSRQHDSTRNEIADALVQEKGA